MTHSFPEGGRVAWTWGAAKARGRISERFERRVQRTISGTRVVRNGTKDNPAYLVEQKDGGKVLKRGSELEKA